VKLAAVEDEDELSDELDEDEDCDDGDEELLVRLCAVEELLLFEDDELVLIT
jgi:hypothetical protein